MVGEGSLEEEEDQVGLGRELVLLGGRVEGVRRVSLIELQFTSRELVGQAVRRIRQRERKKRGRSVSSS